MPFLCTNHLHFVDDLFMSFLLPGIAALPIASSPGPGDAHSLAVPSSPSPPGPPYGSHDSLNVWCPFS